MPTKIDYQKVLAKASASAENYCRICGRDLYGSETDVYYTETKRKTHCFFHAACIIEEARRNSGGKIRTLKFTEANA